MRLLAIPAGYLVALLAHELIGAVLSLRWELGVGSSAPLVVRAAVSMGAATLGGAYAEMMWRGRCWVAGVGLGLLLALLCVLGAVRLPNSSGADVITLVGFSLGGALLGSLCIKRWTEQRWTPRSPDDGVTDLSN